MKTFVARALALSFFASIAALHAQVPQLINYQGRVSVGGVNFNGSGSFKFALVDTTGANTYWSNDGTSLAGSPPTAAVPLVVMKGLYSVLLGDTSLANMTAVPNAVFGNSDVRLRVWFNDGANGSQLLTPDQRIAAVGYAMIAGNVSDGAITSAKIAFGAVGSSQLASGAVGPLQLAPNAVQSVNIASGAIGSSQLAAGAVTAAQIAPGTIGFTSLAKPPQSGTVDGAGLSFDFGQTFFTVIFPQGYPAPPVVALSLAPSSASFPAGITAQVAASSGSQFTGKVATFAASPVVLDSTGDVGQFTSLVIVNGNPAVSYYDQSNADLKYVRASDANGASWGTPVTVDSIANVAFYTSLAIVNGNPAISYMGGVVDGDLKYVRALDVSGTSWAAPVTVDSTGDTGWYTSLAIDQADGYPAISYYDHTNKDLKFVRALDASGTSWGVPVTVASTGDVGLYTSLAIVFGNPAISYYDATNGDLKFARNSAADGSGSWTITTVASAGNVGQYTSLVIVGGRPAISYYDVSNADLKYVRALDGSGTIWGTPVTVDSPGFVGRYTSLAVANGNPAISYYDEGNNFLKYVRASDANGASWGTPVTLDFTGSVGQYTSLAIVSGEPAISYYDATNGNLKFFRQFNPPAGGFKVNWIALPP